LLQEVAPRLLASGAMKLTLYIVDQDSDFKSAAPFHPGERMCADLSLWLDSLERRAPCEEIIKAAGFGCGYLVDEVIYTEYGGNRHSGPRNWPDGQRSPGIIAVTLMERPKRLSREEWIKRWHGKQSPSQRQCSRAPLHTERGGQSSHPGAPPYEGIVEEAWPSVKHATNPFLFYGAGKNPSSWVWNMIVMLRSVTSFLDLTRVRTTMTSEYILKSEPPQHLPAVSTGRRAFCDAGGLNLP